MSRIHAAALVDPKAELDVDVEVGPYTVVGPKVRIGAGTTLGPHVVVDGHTTIGRGNRIFPFASIGLISQDRKYGGEPVTTTIGDENVIREYVSIHAGPRRTAPTRASGTATGSSPTRTSLTTA
jgi:UDP-N-acetylglucosamine acyltransferase